LRDLVEILDQKRENLLDTLKLRQDDVGRYAEGLRYENDVKKDALSLAMQAGRDTLSQVQAYVAISKTMFDQQIPKKIGEHYDAGAKRMIDDYGVWDPTTKQWKPVAGIVSQTSVAPSTPTRRSGTGTSTGGSALSRDEFIQKAYIPVIGEKFSMTPDISQSAIQNEISSLYEEYLKSLGGVVINGVFYKEADVKKLIVAEDRRKMADLGLNPNSTTDIKKYIEGGRGKTERSSSATGPTNPFR
jgi:hypothetical protein